MTRQVQIPGILGSRQSAEAVSLERETGYPKERAPPLKSRLGRPCKLERWIGNALVVAYRSIRLIMASGRGKSSGRSCRAWPGLANASSKVRPPTEKNDSQGSVRRA
jgi:hypothetical protein